VNEITLSISLQLISSLFFRYFFLQITFITALIGVAGGIAGAFLADKLRRRRHMSDREQFHDPVYQGRVTFTPSAPCRIRSDPSSQYGYTDKPSLAVREEPEAVPPEDQEWLTEQAKARDRERLFGEWEPLKRMILRIVEEAGGRAFGPRVRDELRVIRRSVERVSQRL
jgi:hypothetical protein